MFIKRLQLALIHTAVAITLVPINSTLNRVMIFDLGVSKTLFTLLAIFPYLLSPIQVAIGSFSDRHPIMGYRRTPYILAGLLLCVLGVAIAPQIAVLVSENFTLGIMVGIFAFGLWGMGYNLSAVSYLSLASELSGEKGRGKTVATMFTIMVIGLIATGISLSRMVTVYDPETLSRAFLIVAASALTLGLLGLFKLEPPFGRSDQTPRSETYTVKEMTAAITSNPVAKIFFAYLLLLLAAILGQDVLLEPFGAQAFGMSLEQTSRIVSISSTFTLVAFIVAGVLEGRVKKKYIAQMGNLGALIGFLIIVVSGLTGSLTAFYLGITLLGFGTGISTVANLSLMFDLTVPEKVGLYIGAWGFSNGLSRLVGLLMAGVVADLATQMTGSALSGYLVVFSLEALMLLAAAVMLYRIDVGAFQKQAHEPSYVEKVALSVE
ncbi:MAG TPA: BCD family MFS transporter [Anaerolineales bacterium]|nr:BCD family MFS transporter [Anaerolineales bacterium]HMX20391.1 BCD family MFS transporter [Anaerolineales bacterium]HMX74823.1 BCD family MFS transporter [Anaerolineales bacterium]HMZ43692.1 BCD family MFS transporter [Anaerolineales bacterium]HNA54974.1 BCD family MFS transporter [Anaerolineales bacterium]